MEPVWEAVLQSDANTVRTVFSARKDLKSQISQRNSDGLTLLHIASSQGDEEIVSILLANGATPNQTDKKRGWTSMHWAASRKNLRIMALLLKSGGSLHSKDNTDKVTPLDFLEGMQTNLPFLEDQYQHNELYTWGNGMNLQLGIGAESRETPTAVKGFYGEKLRDISCSKYHTIVVSEQGSVYTFGIGKGGRLGHGNEDNQRYPLRIDALLGKIIITAVCVSSQHTMCLSDDGGVYTFGLGNRGQLGLGSDEQMATTPRRVYKNLEGKFVVKIACSRNHSVCLTSDGDLMTWGNSMHGALGYETTMAEIQFFPKPVALRREPTHVAAGSKHTALVIEGELYIMGFGKTQIRRIYLGTKDNVLLKSRVIRVTAGGNMTVVITVDSQTFFMNGDVKPSLLTNENINYVSIVNSDHAFLTNAHGDVWEKKTGTPITRTDLQRVERIVGSKLHTAAIIRVSPAKFSSDEMKADLSEFVASYMLSDITFKSTDGMRYPAHKIILACRSSHIRGMLIQEENKNLSEIVLPDGVTDESVKLFLRYLYTDEIPNSQDLNDVDVRGLLQLCSTFKLKRLQQAVTKNGKLLPSNYMTDFLWGISEEAKILSDVKLTTENINIQSHRVLLAARSMFFNSCLNSGMRETQDSEILIEETPSKFVRPAIHWVYSNTLPPALQTAVGTVGTATFALELMQTADALDLGGLKTALGNYLGSIIDFSNVEVLLEAAVGYQVKELRESCLQFVVKNLKVVLESGSLGNFPPEFQLEVEGEVKWKTFDIDLDEEVTTAAEFQFPDNAKIRKQRRRIENQLSTSPGDSGIPKTQNSTSENLGIPKSEIVGENKTRRRKNKKKKDLLSTSREDVPFIPGNFTENSENFPETDSQVEKPRSGSSENVQAGWKLSESPAKPVASLLEIQLEQMSTPVKTSPVKMPSSVNKTSPVRGFEIPAKSPIKPAQSPGKFAQLPVKESKPLTKSTESVKPLTKSTEAVKPNLWGAKPKVAPSPVKVAPPEPSPTKPSNLPKSVLQSNPMPISSTSGWNVKIKNAKSPAKTSVSPAKEPAWGIQATTPERKQSLLDIQNQESQQRNRGASFSLVAQSTKPEVSTSPSRDFVKIQQQQSLWSKERPKEKGSNLKDIQAQEELERDAYRNLCAIYGEEAVMGLNLQFGEALRLLQESM